MTHPAKPSDPTVHTLAVPGTTLVYDVRTGPDTSEPPLFLIGSPMGAAGFTSLAGHFTDRTVVTYDPRGSERSTKSDMMSPSTPEEHAEDLHRVIKELGAGPVDVFASSGGAVNALALVAQHPEDIRTLVAHEPPLAGLLPDADHAKTAIRLTADSYQRDGLGAGMARFISIVGHVGPFTEDLLGQPAPDPAMFGLPTDDDGSRTDPLLGQNLLTCTHFEPDFEALRAAPTRIVPAAGAESQGQLASRGAHAVAERLGVELSEFPSNHGGFLGGEYGQTGDPVAFAARLREVLASG